MLPSPRVCVPCQIVEVPVSSACPSKNWSSLIFINSLQAPRRPRATPRVLLWLSLSLSGSKLIFSSLLFRNGAWSNSTQYEHAQFTVVCSLPTSALQAQGSENEGGS